jgi:protein TonB
MAIDSSYDEELDPMDRKGDFGASFGGSFGLHLAIIGTIAISLWYSNRFHGNNWGDVTTGAIQASLVSSAPSVPLPSIAPPTKNVLATETPSPAPAIPEKQAAPMEDLKAVQIPVKQPPPKVKPLPDKPQPPQEQKHPQDPPQQHRANFGEQQAANMPKSMANTPNASNSPVQVAGGDFGSRFGYYVNGITRTVSQNWYKQEVDPGTPQGAQTVVTFTIARDGSPSNFRIVRSSGSSSLDTSAIRAAQRVDSFGPLPPAYNGSTVDVAYTFTYQQSNH